MSIELYSQDSIFNAGLTAVKPITQLADPILHTDLATKSYVDLQALIVKSDPAMRWSVTPLTAIPVATHETIGGVKVGYTLSYDASGVLNYILPPADGYTLGGIRIGSTLTKNASGVVDVDRVMVSNLSPVQSVNGMLGDVQLDFTSPVMSVNSKTGSVFLTYVDLGAAAVDHTHDYHSLLNLPVLSGNGTGIIDLSGLHYINDPLNATNGQVLTYSDSAHTWVASSISVQGNTPSGGSLMSINGSSFAKAWVQFDGTRDHTGAVNTNATDRYIINTYNVNSVRKVYAGSVNDYVVTFADAMTDTKYVVTGSTSIGTGGATNNLQIHSTTNTYVEPTLTDFHISVTGTSPSVNTTLTVFSTGSDITGNVIDSTPVGIIKWSAAKTPPVGYKECNGDALNRSIYRELDNTIYCGNSLNNTASFGYRCTNRNNPSNSRNINGQYIVIPDLRGEFIRGWDNDKGVDINREFGTHQADTFKSHTHTVADPGHSHLFDGSLFDNDAVTSQTTSPNGKLSNRAPVPTQDAFTNIAINTTGSTETKPRNISLLPCIKVLSTFTGTVDTFNFIEKPAVVITNQVLGYSGSESKWKAINVADAYGINIKNNIVNKAACFTPLMSGTGTWIAPEGCTAIRITAVGGGGGCGLRGTAGGASRFNIPDGVTTAYNQVLAGGGYPENNGVPGLGGNASWNGIVAHGGAAAINGETAMGNMGAGGGGGGGNSNGMINNTPGGGGSWGGVQSFAYGGGRGGAPSGNIVPAVSYIAQELAAFQTISHLAGAGASGTHGGGGGGGWCSVLIEVIPGTEYQYQCGRGGTKSAEEPSSIIAGRDGFILIEW